MATGTRVNENARNIEVRRKAGEEKIGNRNEAITQYLHLNKSGRGLPRYELYRKNCRSYSKSSKR